LQFRASGWGAGTRDMYRGKMGWEVDWSRPGAKDLLYVWGNRSKVQSHFRSLKLVPTDYPAVSQHHGLEGVVLQLLSRSKR
jgi:hypothetical protein